MKRIKLIVGALMALTALTAVATSTASAALPEFSPASGTFTATSGPGTLQIKGGGAISCKADTVKNGVITNEKLFTATVDFTSCTALGLTANSEGDAAGTILIPLDGDLCYLSKSAKTVGALLKILPEAGVNIEIPSVKEKIVVRGTGVAEVKPVNTKTKTGELILTQKEGKQGISKCEGGSETSFEGNENGKGFVAAGEQTTDTISFTNETEVLA
jgi:hypothetical protein